MTKPTIEFTLNTVPKTETTFDVGSLMAHLETLIDPSQSTRDTLFAAAFADILGFGEVRWRGWDERDVRMGSVTGSRFGQSAEFRA